MPVLRKSDFYLRRLAFPICLTLGLLSSALFYMHATFLLLLPVLVVFFVVCLIRVVLKPTRNHKLIHLLVAAGLLASWGRLSKAGDCFGDDLRWSIWSSRYKRSVDTRPASAGDFADPNPRHMLWRVWGGLGIDFEADLVFDQSSTLAQAADAKSYDMKKVYGCNVEGVHQLERNWYIVTLYANEGWPGC